MQNTLTESGQEGPTTATAPTRTTTPQTTTATRLLLAAAMAFAASNCGKTDNPKCGSPTNQTANSAHNRKARIMEKRRRDRRNKRQPNSDDNDQVTQGFGCDEPSIEVNCKQEDPNTPPTCKVVTPGCTTYQALPDNQHIYIFTPDGQRRVCKPYELKTLGDPRGLRSPALKRRQVKEVEIEKFRCDPIPQRETRRRTSRD